MKDNVVNGLPQYLYLPVDFIIHFENIQEEFTNMIRHFDKNINTILPHSNKSKKNYSTKFSINDLYPKTILMINDKYDEDFKQFGYKKI